MRLIKLIAVAVTQFANITDDVCVEVFALALAALSVGYHARCEAMTYIYLTCN